MTAAIDPAVLLLTPVPLERQALVATISRECALLPVSGLRLEADYAPDLRVLLAAGGHGKAQFGIQAQYLIGRFPEARLMICAGAAGRLDPDLKVGDIVIARETVEHDFREKIKPRPLPRFAADPLLLERVRAAVEATKRSYRVVIDTVASGDIDCVDVEHGCTIRRETEAACVAWEGAGAFRAARFNGISCLELRAISDAADEDAEKHFFQNVGRVMGNLGEVALDLVKALGA